MILSASRRCDIPAHYSDWLIHRVREGYALVRNPMNCRQVSRIDLTGDAVDCIVFWTKNPAPILPALRELGHIPHYFQFTLNGYGRDVEPGLPERAGRVDSFRRLSDRIGPERVIWRYDPILLNGTYRMDQHTEAFYGIARELCGYTQKAIFSFVDFYAKTDKRMTALGASEPTHGQKRMLAKEWSAIAGSFGLTLETCAEDIDLVEFGIGGARCVDDRLIERLCGYKPDAKKDPNQRPACGCAQSVDIGAYNCCPHGCAYCYANYSPSLVKRNIAAHDPASPLLIGGISPDDRITRRNLPGMRTATQIGMLMEDAHDEDGVS